MRSNAANYDLIAPPSLEAVLAVLASEPGSYTVLAGGTEIMVALGAGRLSARRLISIQHLRELRFLSASDDTLILGAGTTFTDIRRDAILASEFPLLVQAASWTGSIANQNRGTLGGNIVNGSPAADSPPALLAYEAELTLLSSRGTRVVPYTDFHLGYKRTILAPDELLYSIALKRSYQGYKTYSRKVGTRKAQAISKVAIAALARVEEGRITDVRIGAASLQDRPARMTATEQAVLGQAITADTMQRAREAVLAESHPIDDIRSTARYRGQVAANLVEEFLRSLQTDPR
ncbi:MAG: FAD binding domain-containing protein [Acidobacteriota bacterium]|nr:FAD binding domain-containing protein [Acidobacteriota bacterium]